ncbi:MAG: DUF4338 domain-containing protein [Phycisphaerae bacterium]
MDVILRYRGRNICSADVEFIEHLITKHPRLSRRGLSKKLCEEWNWVQPNGHLCDMVCRGLMLELHRRGLIALPPRRMTPPNPLMQRARPECIEVAQIPLCASLKEIGPVELRQVRRRAEESLVNSLIEQHHYLGYVQPVGEHLKYLVTAQDRPVGCLCWSSAARHLGPRDRYIGWSQAARRENIRFIAYQSRFLILPWVRVPHLASHVLGRMSRQLSADWQRVYAHPIYFTETFIDPSRYAGTCYRAANWIYLGMTTGRGKNDQTNKPNRTLKQVFGYPLQRGFRRKLLGNALSCEQQKALGARQTS